MSLQSTWEVELSVLSIVKVILMYKRSFMSVDFRKRSCPLFSVWEDFMLKFSLDEKDKDYFMAGVIKEKDQTLFLFKLVYRCFTVLCYFLLYNEVNQPCDSCSVMPNSLQLPWTVTCQAPLSTP